MFFSIIFFVLSIETTDASIPLNLTQQETDFNTISSTIISDFNISNLYKPECIAIMRQSALIVIYGDKFWHHHEIKPPFFFNPSDSYTQIPDTTEIPVILNTDYNLLYFMPFNIESGIAELVYQGCNYDDITNPSGAVVICQPHEINSYRNLVRNQKSPELTNGDKQQIDSSAGVATTQTLEKAFDPQEKVGCPVIRTTASSNIRRRASASEKRRAVKSASYSTDRLSTDTLSTDTLSTDTPSADTPSADTPSADTPSADTLSTDTVSTAKPTQQAPHALTFECFFDAPAIETIPLRRKKSRKSYVKGRFDPETLEGLQNIRILARTHSLKPATDHSSKITEQTQAIKTEETAAEKTMPESEEKIKTAVLPNTRKERKKDQPDTKYSTSPSGIKYWLANAESNKKATAPDRPKAQPEAIVPQQPGAHEASTSLLPDKKEKPSENARLLPKPAEATQNIVTVEISTTSLVQAHRRVRKKKQKAPAPRRQRHLYPRKSLPARGLAQWCSYIQSFCCNGRTQQLSEICSDFFEAHARILKNQPEQQLNLIYLKMIFNIYCLDYCQHLCFLKSNQLKFIQQICDSNAAFVRKLQTPEWRYRASMILSFTIYRMGITTEIQLYNPDRNETYATYNDVIKPGIIIDDTPVKKYFSAEKQACYKNQKVTFTAPYSTPRVKTKHKKKVTLLLNGLGATDYLDQEIKEQFFNNKQMMIHFPACIFPIDHLGEFTFPCLHQELIPEIDHNPELRQLTDMLDHLLAVAAEYIDTCSLPTCALYTRAHYYASAIYLVALNLLLERKIIVFCRCYDYETAQKALMLYTIEKGNMTAEQFKSDDHISAYFEQDITPPSLAEDSKENSIILFSPDMTHFRRLMLPDK